MISFPHCKINLGLNILEKRADGYHDIETCFYPVPLTDILEIIPSEQFSFSVSGARMEGDPKENLCVSAYELLKNDFALPKVSIHLHKTIPSGAGLGGGSSDAAFTIRMLKDIFHIALSSDEMKNYARKIGSDCSFFIEDKPMAGSGKGDKLTSIPVSLTGKFLVIVKPPIHIATAEAYQHVIPGKPSAALEETLSKPVSEWPNDLKNDFEESVFRRYPEIGKIKRQLYEEGALYASMSGSGSAVYGIFESKTDVKDKFSGVFYWSAVLAAAEERDS